MASRKRWLGRLGAAAVLSAAALGAVASPAFAHNYEIGSTPKAGATITTQPDVISITTNDNLLSLDGINSGMGIQIAGPGSGHPLYYGDGCVKVFGPTIETEAKLGQPGQYTVTWQVISADGHSVSDSFTFTWKPDAGQQLATGSPTAPACGGTAKAGAATASPAPGGGEAAGRNATDATDITDVLWIGGAVLVVLIAVVVTLVLVRRKSRGDAPLPPIE